MKFEVALVALVLTIAAHAVDDEILKLEEAFREANSASKKCQEFDRLYIPVFDRLVSPNAFVRSRAVQMVSPMLERQWIAIDQFERLGWDRLDAKGKGLYLWCSASAQSWYAGHDDHPLKPIEMAKLWVAAAQEPVALPFLRETALTWFARRSTEYKRQKPLGDSLPSASRKKISEQYLTTFKNCSTYQERAAVLWMILDLQQSDDPTLSDWYGAEENADIRDEFLRTLTKMVAQPTPETPREESDIVKFAGNALKKRIPVLQRLAATAQQDWDSRCAASAQPLLASAERINLMPPHVEPPPPPERKKIPYDPNGF